MEGNISSPSLPARSLVLKVVIPVKTGIQTNSVRHVFWIPNRVGKDAKIKKRDF